MKKIVTGLVYLLFFFFVFLNGGCSTDPPLININPPGGGIESDPVLISHNQWKSGLLNTGDVHWYYFNGIEGSRYTISWDDEYEGTDTTADIYVSVYREDKTTDYFTLDDSGYNFPREITALATEKVMIKVQGYTTLSAGTYGVKFIDEALMTSPPVEITPGGWEVGSLSEGEIQFYYIDLLADETIKITWDDSAQGSGSYTGNVSVSSFTSDSSETFFSSTSNGYTVSKYATPTADARVYIRVQGDSHTSSGSYGIRVDRVETLAEPRPVGSLFEDSLVAGEVKWYYFDATAGDTYFLYWFDALINGGSYTVGTRISLYHADQETPIFVDARQGYDDPQMISVDSNERLYIRVEGSYSYSSGDYAMKILKLADIAEPLTYGEWKSDTLAEFDDKWYYIDATEGEGLVLTLDDSSDGSGTYTADAKVSVFRPDITTKYISLQSNCYAVPANFIITASERIYVKLEGINYLETGSCRLKVEKVSSIARPLTSGTWQDESILESGKHWYYYDVAAGNNYELQWEGHMDGPSGCTARIDVSLYRQNLAATPYFFEEGYGFYGDHLVNATATERVYILVGQSVSSSEGAGTYRVRIFDIATEAVGLTPGTASSGSFLIDEEYKYFYIDSTAGTRYEFSLDYMETTQYSVIYSAYQDNMTDDNAYFLSKQGYDSSDDWDPQHITVSSDGRIYIKVKKYGYINATGTFDIKVTDVTTLEQALTLGTPAAGELLEKDVDLFYFAGVIGGKYRVSIYDVSSSAYTGDVKVTALSSTLHGTPYYEDVEYRFPFVAPSEDGRVYLKIRPRSEFTLGTYAVKVDDIAAIAVQVPFSSYDLYDKTISNEDLWFYFDAVAGTSYQIQWADNGDGTRECPNDCDANLILSAYHEDFRTGAYFLDVESGFTTPQTLTATTNERIYIQCRGSVGDFRLMVTPQP